MKYDLSKTPTRGARRTLDAFTGAMLALLAKQPFEAVTVNELCQQSGYPRATFYNYFDDKFDLLGYCWYRLGELINLDEGPDLAPEDGVHVFFDRICQLAETQSEIVHSVLAHNVETGYLQSSLRITFVERIADMMQGCACREGSDMPHDLLAAHFANTVLLVLERRLLHQPPCTNEEAHRYLHVLLESV